MSLHLYRVGEPVALTPHSGTYLKTGAAYFVSAQLPPSGDTLQYRVKCGAEPYERVVAEHQLNRLDPEAAPPLEAVDAPASPATQSWARRGIQAAPAVAPRARAHSRTR